MSVPRGSAVVPRVHIVIVNWNHWWETEECLRSLEDLDYPNFHVTVVDNGSANDSAARIRHAFPDVTVLESGKNLGFAGGNNIGIRWAIEQSADYVWLLNNDTKADRSALRALVETAERNADLGAVGSLLYAMDPKQELQLYGGGQVNLWLGIPRGCKEPVGEERLAYITGASVLLRSSALEQIGLLDESFFMYWEDTDLGFRLRAAGWRLGVATGSKVLHKEFGSLGRKSPVTDMYFNDSAVRFFRRHAPCPFFPIVVGVGGRLLKRLVVCDWPRATAVVKGAWAGWNCSAALGRGSR